jgi:hypothetical protein
VKRKCPSADHDWGRNSEVVVKNKKKELQLLKISRVSTVTTVTCFSSNSWIKTIRKTKPDLKIQVPPPASYRHVTIYNVEFRTAVQRASKLLSFPSALRPVPMACKNIYMHEPLDLLLFLTYAINLMQTIRVTSVTRLVCSLSILSRLS